MVGRVLVIAALCASCRYGAAFECQTDEQCRHGTTPGRCESVGFCSFPDSGCASGFRFDDNSGTGYAGACVGDEMPPPDAEIDAPGMTFDIARCPTSYTVQVTSTSTTSRYRILLGAQTWWYHAASCDADLADATHLATLQSSTEMVEVIQQVRLTGTMVATFFIGAVQDPSATMPAAGWVLLDDASLPTGLWYMGEPDDDDGVENQATQLGFIDVTFFQRGMNDGSGLVTRAAICECDGKTYGPTARAHVDGDPNNPD